MPVLQHRVTIDAPADQVWKALADLEAVQHYNPNVVTARYISASREGVGASRECQLKPKGAVKERVIDWQPMRSITMELYESDWPIAFMRWRTELAANGKQTVLTQRMDYAPKFGLLGRALDVLVMRRKLDSSLATVFERLRQFVESSGARN